MFCPQCSAEYREGFTVCSDCEVGLVATLGEPSSAEEDQRRSRLDDPRPDMELVTVFESTNPALVGIAKTLLEAAGMEYLAVGGSEGGVFAGNPFLGHVQLQVEKARVEEATELLSEIEESDEPLADEPLLGS